MSYEDPCGERPRIISRKALGVVGAIAVASLALCLPRAAVAATSGVPGAILVRDSLGDSDTIFFDFPPGDFRSASARVHDALIAARLPERSVVVDQQSSTPTIMVVRVGTTIGRRVSPLTRVIDGTVFEHLDTFGYGAVYLDAPRVAHVLMGSVVRQPSAGNWQRLRIIGYSSIEYAVPWSALWFPSLVLIGSSFGCFAASRFASERIVRRHEDIVDAVFGLRKLSLLSAPVMIAGLLIAVGSGAISVPGLVLGAFASAVTRIPAIAEALVMPAVFMMITAPAIAFAKGVAPVLRRVRGVEPMTRTRRMRFSAILITPVAAWTVFVLAVTPSLPPLGRFVATMGFLLLLQVVMPSILMRALPTKTLQGGRRARAVDLIERTGVHVADIRVLDTYLSTVANAFAIGLLRRGRYIVVTDVLLEEFDERGFDAVIAHELGHVKEHHIVKRLALWFGGILLLELFVASGAGLGGSLGAALELTAMTGLIAFFYLHGRYGIALEERADDFAVAIVGALAMTSALDRLATVNHVKRNTGRWWSWVTQHPGIAQRVARLREAADVGVPVRRDEDIG